MKKILCALIASLCALLSAENTDHSLHLPGFKGTLLSPSPYFPGRGHQQYELYTTWIERDRRFNHNWDTTSIRHFDTLLFFPILKFGSSPRTEIDITPQLFYNHSEGPHNWRFGDCDFAFAIRLLEENRLINLGPPTIKLRLRATVPFGKYDRLNPNKHRTDAAGNGAVDPSLSLLFGKHLHISNDRWVCFRAGYTYSFGTTVNICGSSVYGDSEILGSKVYLGNRWEANLGFEATLVGKLSFIGDLVAFYRDSTHYSKQKQAAPSSLVFTAAPGLEYDFSEQIGILVGPAIDFAGRNDNCDFAWILSIKIHN